MSVTRGLFEYLASIVGMFAWLASIFLVVGAVLGHVSWFWPVACILYIVWVENADFDYFPWESG